MMKKHIHSYINPYHNRDKTLKWIQLGAPQSSSDPKDIYKCNKIAMDIFQTAPETHFYKEWNNSRPGVDAAGNIAISSSKD